MYEPDNNFLSLRYKFPSYRLNRSYNIAVEFEKYAWVRRPAVLIYIHVYVCMYIIYVYQVRKRYDMLLRSKSTLAAGDPSGMER